MLKTAFLWRFFLLLLVAGSMFALGVATHKNEYRPYRMARDLFRRAFTDPQKMLSTQYSRDNKETALDQGIDSALLPLVVAGLRISERQPIPKGSGSITIVGNSVIVLDRLGNLYSYRRGEDQLSKLPAPELPNNMRDYLTRGQASVDDRTFRAIKILWLESSGQLAVSHEYYDVEGRGIRLAVSVIAFDQRTMLPTGAWKTIFRSEVQDYGPNNNGGGMLAVAGPDKLYLSIGDYMIKAGKPAQNPKSDFGKIIEINLRTQQHKIFSSGHRNPQGLFVTKKGDVLSTEHGPAGGDELNHVTEGSNYGWPDVTLGTEYGTYEPNNEHVGEHDGFKMPMFGWVPSIGVANLIEIAGFHRRWDGDLLVASLKAQSLFRLRLDGMRVVYAEPVYIGQRIRDIGQFKDGSIVLWTDSTQLLFVSVDKTRLDQNQRPVQPIGDSLRYSCMYCHHFGPTRPSDFAPSLTNLIGRKIASDNFRYSDALRSMEGAWTPERLSDYLSNPAKFASGTSMPAPHLSRFAIDDIIRDLEHAASDTTEH